MDYSSNVRALAAVITHVAPEVQLTRAAESCTYSRYEYRRYAWFMGRVSVHVSDGKVTLRYPVGKYVTSNVGYGWATSLIERALELLEDSPHAIPLEAGLIDHEFPGCTSYTAS